MSIEIVLSCDRCESRVSLTEGEFIDWHDETTNLPHDWFEHEGKHYCSKHQLITKREVEDL